MTGTRVIGIVGPTAVGKSSLAESVALALGGEIVSVDSMQVYRGMDIGTAKVAECKRSCPLHMVDVTDVWEPYSVARFQQDARACIDALARVKKPPVLCGGTGLYLDAVIDDMRFPHGDTVGETRVGYERIAEEQGEDALHAMLAQRDPLSAQEIHPHNVRRVIRALEMLDEGVSYAEHHKGLKAHVPHYDARLWALTMPREQLHERISERVDAMFDEGLVDEVRQLADRGLRDAATASQAIGYKEVLAYLSGDVSLDTARELVKRNTRRYAKRQFSWLRRDGRVRWIDMALTPPTQAVSVICDDWRHS